MFWESKAMLTRRNFIKRFSIPFFGFILSIPHVSTLWAQAKKILLKGFKREKLRNMNPAEIDNRNLEVDPLEKFGTMGPTDVAVDVKAYQLKISGAVNHPLSLSYDQILKFPSMTEVVLLICPGFFANNGRWTGVRFKPLLQEAHVKEEAKYLDVKGAYGKVARIPLKDLEKKKIFLAYRVNGKPLPQKHGFPLRLVDEDAYGYNWVKYVDELVVL
jgi:DMSO/TMAO reductase YedYZ molybdopterin-dependent catalytic subunit